MSYNIRPILSALLRNRTGAILVALQIALALAILVNATYIVKQRVESINRPTGIDDENLFAIEASGFTGRYDYDSSVREDLNYLRGLAGVIDATVTEAVPLSGSGSSIMLYRTPDRKASSEVMTVMYEMDEHALQTLGSHIIAGRFFRKEEIMSPMTTNNQSRPIPNVVIDEPLARKLFPPDGNAVGKVVYDVFGRATTIIGITPDMIGPWNVFEHQRRVMFMPQMPRIWGFFYLVRAKPGHRDELMRIAADHLATSNNDRVIKSVRSVEAYKRRLFLPEKITAIFLVIVTTALLAVASLGIFGLATFNVSTRTKQIGTRRAVGARKRDIIRHFMVENALVTTAGVVVGCALALAVGYILSVRYQLPRLDLYYLVGGVIVLWAIGQFAAWQPARRASTVSPSIATRTA